MLSISAATPSAVSASRIARRLAVKCCVSVSSTLAATVSAWAAAAARSRCSGSASSYSGIGRVQTRLSKSRLSRWPCGWRSVTLARTAAVLMTATRYAASAGERAGAQYALCVHQRVGGGDAAALSRVPALL